MPSNKKLVIITLAALVVLVVVLLYWHSTYYESTDDAEVDGHIVQISARIVGHVASVTVEDNESVVAGQTLAVIDPSDYQVAVDQATAALANAEANYEAAEVGVPITSITTSSSLRSAGADVQGSTASVDQSRLQMDAAQERVAEAQANSTKAQADLDRYTPLVQKDVISKQQYDGAVQAADSANASVLEAKANLVAAEEGVHIAEDRLAESRASLNTANTGTEQVKVQRAKADQAAAQVKQAEADLEQAQLNLSYTKITAPVSGVVDKKSVEIGQNIGVGQDLLTIIPLDPNDGTLWVTANFKETQLKHMQAGQKVVIKVDALGGRKFSGVVTQIGGATGSRLSLFPPENATGNYVKVVQRIPVRIDFTDLKDEDSGRELRPGFSVVPDVSVK
jgi:membrane fusion protein (multidrug efflux system)